MILRQRYDCLSETKKKLVYFFSAADNSGTPSLRRFPRKFEKIQGIQKKFNKLFNEKSKIHQTKFEKLPDHSDPIKADQNLFTGKIVL